MANLITAIQDRSVTTLADVKDYLDITDASEDAFLTFLLDVCKRKADDYCLNPFLDTDGVTELAIPLPVELGLRVCVKYEYQQKSATSGTAGPIVMEKAGDLQVKYSDRITDSESVDQVPAGARRLWKPYRLVPGF